MSNGKDRGEIYHSPMEYVVISIDCTEQEGSVVGRSIAGDLDRLAHTYDVVSAFLVQVPIKVR